MKFIICIFAYIAASCPYTTCNVYSKITNICFQTRDNTSIQYNDIFGEVINNKFYLCPLNNTFCNANDVSLNNTMHCEPLLSDGSICQLSNQCLSGNCILRKCTLYPGSLGMNCSINSDCIFKLVCRLGKCSTPITLGAACTYVTILNATGQGMDVNDCDYTLPALCGNVGNTTSNTCLKLFSVPTAYYVTNPLLCQSMITSNGWGAGYCIVNRQLDLPSLNLPANLNYHTCTNDSNCQYKISSVNTSSIVGSCKCARSDLNGTMYCDYGGGEQQIIDDVTYIQKYWIPQFNMNSNDIGKKFMYVLDNTLRNSLNNPAYCSYESLIKNVTVVSSSNTGHTVLMIIVLSLFAISFAGLIVTFMC